MKRIRKVVIVDQELTPTVLATIETKKTGVGLFGVLLLFAIFGSFTYYLPTISAYVDGYLHPEKRTNLAGKGENPNNTEKKYPYKDNLTITSDFFDLTKISFKNNDLSFSIKNKKVDNLKMDDYNYFLEFFDESEKLLERVKLENIPVILPNKEEVVNITLKSQSFSMIQLKEMKIEDYPPYIVALDDDKFGRLTCTKDNETVEYVFKDNQLQQIDMMLTIDSTTPDFMNVYTTYQALASTYNNIVGVTSTLDLKEEGVLLFKTNINLVENNGTSLNLSRVIYSKDTDAKVVYFEMPLKNYVCK